jgi:hypothetical protein
MNKLLMIDLVNKYNTPLQNYDKNKIIEQIKKFV